MLKTRLLKCIDGWIGGLAVRCMPRPVPAGMPQLRSVLLIRPGGIGDAALLPPVIRLMRCRYPDARITVLAERRNGPIFALCPTVDRVLLYDRPRELLAAIRGGYDVVIDTEQWHRLSAVVARLTRAQVSIGYATNERQRLFSHPIPYSHDDYELDSFHHLLRPLGIDPPAESDVPFLFVPESAERAAMALLGASAERAFVVIFPGASIPERRWGAERFRELARRLHDAGANVVVVGGEGDRADGELICSDSVGFNLAGRTSLVESAAVINRAALLVSGDSGLLHVGVGLGVPTVSLFGPGIAAKWAPRGEAHIVLDKRLSCSPCTRFGYTPRCRDNGRCLKEITVDEVELAVMRLLSRARERKNIGLGR